jgi:NADH:ubiquinone oxidoreductase subunit D/NADH:ubiquinone oxidoreductase subunit C
MAMEDLKELLEKFDTEYVEPYKDVWMKAKLNNAKDLLKVVQTLIDVGVKTCSTVSPTDFIDEDKMEINYFLEDVQHRRNVWLKVDIPRELDRCKIDSITPLMPSANWHELESYSTFGVKFEGHPDLRFFLISNDFYGVFPFRKDFDYKTHEENLISNVNSITQEYRDEYEEHETNEGHEGSQTVLNWGPTHPASGPLRLRVYANGENIEQIKPDIGYVWRALENLVERKDFIGAIVAVERICFMDNPNALMCYAQAVEEIADKEITRFAKLMRVVLGETGRSASHLISMGGFFGNMGLQTFMMWALDVRESFLDVLEEYSGARIATASIEPGGVRYPLPDAQAWFATVEKAMDKWKSVRGDIEDIFMKNPLMTTRAKNMGIFTKEDVDKYYLAGPIARSTGAKVDIRLDEPYAAYDEMDMTYAKTETGDTRDRLWIIYREIEQSMDLIEQALKKIKAGIDAEEMDPTKDHMVKIPKKLPAGEAISRVEWARGELLMHLVTQEKGTSPYRLKIKAPSVNHTMVLDHILTGKTLSDIPLLYGSMHICQGDLDR